MKREWVDQAVTDSRKIMENYWLGDPEYCIARLDEQIDWTGSGEHEHRNCTRQEMAELLREYATHNPTVYLTEAVYYPVTVFQDGCAVFGTYIGQTEPDSGYLIRERQRVTFLWKLKGHQLVLTSMHISNPMETVKPGESFPFAIGKSSWEYVRHQITTGVKRNTQQIVVKAVGGVLHVLALSDVVYLEARDRYTIVHSIEDSFIVRACLSEMEAKMDESFLRIGRSFAVNVTHVKTFEKSSILLFGGEEIPVPVRTAAALREEFLHRMK